MDVQKIPSQYSYPETWAKVTCIKGYFPRKATFNSTKDSHFSLLPDFTSTCPVKQGFWFFEADSIEFLQLFAQ